MSTKKKRKTIFEPIELLQVKRKDGKIYSHIRKKWLVETPEERVRQADMALCDL